MAERARTLPVHGNKRINWNRVSYVEVVPQENGYVFTIRWKYKASIKEESFEYKDPNLNVQQFLMRFNLIKITDNIYVNLNRILLIEENSLAMDRVKVRIVFEDGFQLSIILEETFWNWWKSSYA